ncbi:MAG: GIY-YIG nuclease family protein [Bacteroidia bacterium]|nr:GIY-YIG nuclease family protein [Bacteroidia bacterium]
MYYAYVLRSLTTGFLYKGSTQDLAARVAAHNAGFSPYTKGRGPWELVHFEEFPTRGDQAGKVFQK